MPDEDGVRNNPIDLDDVQICFAIVSHCSF